MSKIFISYKHVDPDQALADFLRDYLAQRRHSVFLDTQIVVGDNWTEEIDHHIRTSDFFIVLLSQESIRSEMVVEEVKRAYERIHSPTENLTILPVRVAFKGKLPYDLAAYLGRIQYASWEKGASFETIADQLVAAIERDVDLPGEDTSDKHAFSEEGIPDFADEKGAPWPSMDPRQTGAVQPDSPFYIERAVDDVVLKQVRGTGTTTIVKGARQMGKSSLLARANAAACGNSARPSISIFSCSMKRNWRAWNAFFEAWRMRSNALSIPESRRARHGTTSWERSRI